MYRRTLLKVAVYARARAAARSLEHTTMPARIPSSTRSEPAVAFRPEVRAHSWGMFAGRYAASHESHRRTGDFCGLAANGLANPRSAAEQWTASFAVFAPTFSRPAGQLAASAAYV